MERENNLKILTRYEIETALAKLIFYLLASSKYEPYKEYKNKFEEMLEIVMLWVKYYVDNDNLLNMTDDEVISIQKLMDEIPNDAWNGDYFEEVDIWLSTVIFYGSCPVNQEYDESKIIRKGKVI